METLGTLVPLATFIIAFCSLLGGLGFVFNLLLGPIKVSLDQMKDNMNHFQKDMDQMKDNLNNFKNDMNNFKNNMDHFKQDMDQVKGNQARMEQRMDKIELKLDHLLESQSPK